VAGLAITVFIFSSEYIKYLINSASGLVWKSEAGIFSID